MKPTYSMKLVDALLNPFDQVVIGIKENIPGNCYFLNNDSITRSYISNHQKENTMKLTAKLANELSQAARTDERLQREYNEIMDEVKTYAENGRIQTYCSHIYVENIAKLSDAGFKIAVGQDRDGDVRYTISW
jgi:hypothetical protein